VTQRLVDDRHVWATTLFDEVVELGYSGSYPSFTRALRVRELRPGCPACAAGSHRDAGVIGHPPGEETQFDWLELPDPPPGWGLSGSAHLLVGSLAHSSRWRAVLAESEDQPHLIEALDGVVRRLGGVPGTGGSTGWPRSVTRRRGGSPPASPRSRNTTAPG
jgi:hypothetical protein